MGATACARMLWAVCAAVLLCAAWGDAASPRDTTTLVTTTEVVQLSDDLTRLTEMVTKVNIPTDIDIIVTGYLWELVDAETDEVLDIANLDYYVHHSAVHPLADGENTEDKSDIMHNAIHIIGVTPDYNRYTEFPYPYGVGHWAGEWDWYMCCHLTGTAEKPRVYQRLTLHYHERRPDDRRVVMQRLGKIHNDHDFGPEVRYEERTFIGKLPEQPLRTMGVMYHFHEGVQAGRLIDSLTGAHIHEFSTEGLPHVQGVVKTATAFIDPPYEYVDGQFLYFHTTTLAAGKQFHMGGPMQIAMLYNDYEDQDFVPYLLYNLNLSEAPCYPEFLGLPPTGQANHIVCCEEISWDMLSSARLRPQVMPPPYLRACSAVDGARCRSRMEPLHNPRCRR